MPTSVRLTVRNNLFTRTLARSDCHLPLRHVQCTRNRMPRYYYGLFTRNQMSALFVGRQNGGNVCGMTKCSYSYQQCGAARMDELRQIISLFGCSLELHFSSQIPQPSSSEPPQTKHSTMKPDENVLCSVYERAPRGRQRREWVHQIAVPFALILALAELFGLKSYLITVNLDEIWDPDVKYPEIKRKEETERQRKERGRGGRKNFRFDLMVFVY